MGFDVFYKQDEEAEKMLQVFSRLEGKWVYKT